MPPTNIQQPGASPGTPGLQGGPRPTPGTSANVPPPVDLEQSYERQELTGGTSSRDSSERHGRSGWSPGQQNLGEVGHELKDQARQTAEQAYEQVRNFTGQAMDNARRQWEESRGHFTERFGEVAHKQKEHICKGMDDAIEAARAAAEVLEERNDPQVASWARWGADGLEQTRDYLRRVDVEHIGNDVRNFTRRHPEWVLGGLFIAGLAVARFLKADRMGSRGRLPDGADDGLWGDIVESQHRRSWDDRGYGSTDASRDFGSGGGFRAGSGSYTGSQLPRSGATPGTYDTDAGRAGTGGVGGAGAIGQSAGSTAGIPGPQRGDRRESTDSGSGSTGGGL